MSRDNIVSARFSDVERGRLDDAARRLGCTVSDLIRRAALDVAAPLPRRDNHPWALPTGTSTPVPGYVVWMDGTVGYTWPGVA